MICCQMLFPYPCIDPTVLLYGGRDNKKQVKEREKKTKCNNRKNVMEWQVEL